MKSLHLFVLFVGSLILSGCVTTIESRLTQKADPEKAVYNYTQLGLGYIKQGRFDRARLRINRALEIDEDYAPANNAMALLLQSEHEPELAERYFLKSIDLDKGFSQSHYNYGMFLMQNKRYKEASKHLKIASEDVDYQQRSQAAQSLGLSYYLSRDVYSAITTYKKILKQQRFNAPVLVNLSTILFERGRHTEAQEYYDRFIRLVARNKSEHTANSLWLGIILGRVHKNYEHVEKFAHELKTSFPDSTEYERYLNTL